MRSKKREAVIRQAAECDARALADLEISAWAAPLQATETLVRRRFAMGHTMLIAETEGILVGSICFVATDKDPLPREEFPQTFKEFSSIRRSKKVLSLYTYNLCVRPEYRGTSTVNRLLNALTEYGTAVGARWLVGDGRCPSYAGSLPNTPDTVQPDPKFRAAIDQWAQTGKMPSVTDITRDPLLNFYHRTLHCRFLHLMPNFLPEDTASGGFRVIFAIDLNI